MKNAVGLLDDLNMYLLLNMISMIMIPKYLPKAVIYLAQDANFRN